MFKLQIIWHLFLRTGNSQQFGCQPPGGRKHMHGQHFSFGLCDLEDWGKNHLVFQVDDLLPISNFGPVEMESVGIIFHWTIEMLIIAGSFRFSEQHPECPGLGGGTSLKSNKSALGKNRGP